MRLKKPSAAKGSHHFVTRFEPLRLRSLAVDEKYRQGEWDFKQETTHELPSAIRKPVHGGDLLILGCGGASLLGSFDSAHLQLAENHKFADSERHLLVFR